MAFLYISPFLYNLQKHGAVKRTYQIKEQLDRSDCLSINPNTSFPKFIYYLFSKPLVSINIFFYSVYIFIFKGVSLRGAILLFLKTPYLVSLIKVNRSRHLIVEGGNSFSILIQSCLNFLGIEHTVCVQNVEYLVNNDSSDLNFRNKFSKFNMETMAYKLAKSVISISKFDQAVLACHNIKSILLPYYPSSKELNLYSSIRINREKTKIQFNSKKVFLLGTTLNYPTKIGIENALEVLKNLNFQYEIIVAGYGTDCFNHYSNKNISILGEITDAELLDLMLTSKCLIINQIQTSGFLTKIVDFNISGIPIIITSNYLQSNNLEGYGVYKSCFDNLQKTIDNLPDHFCYNYFEKPTLDLFSI